MRYDLAGSGEFQTMSFKPGVPNQLVNKKKERNLNGCSYPVELIWMLVDQTIKKEIKVGGVQASNIFFSAERQDINAIPKTTPMFSVFGSIAIQWRS